MKKENNHALINLLKIIDDISNKEYQKRVWIDGKGPECDDFDDTVCDFFGIGESIIKKHNIFGITDNQHQLLTVFYNEFRTFSNEHTWPPEFIDTLEWTRITEMAREVLKAFHWKMPSKNH
jgi:hypothetical protein